MHPALAQVDGHEHECAGAIGNDYQVVDDGFNGDAIIYRTSKLTLQGSGKEGIDEMDQWGKVGALVRSFVSCSLPEVDWVGQLRPYLWQTCRLLQHSLLCLRPRRFTGEDGKL